MSTGTKPGRKAAATPRPSSSILVISPKNQVLLLHRVKTSSSFASAHVFPGGNVDPKQDGELPLLDTKAHHEDSPTYRLAGIRECFEESGLLLAKDSSSGKLLRVSEPEREKARREIHEQKLRFPDWVRQQGGVPDTEGLHPFTRFITPTTAPKRFTTQMYIYFLPLTVPEETLTASEREAQVPTPTSDGGVEHTTAQFLWPSQWLSMGTKNDIMMYPPQVYLLHLIEPFFKAGKHEHDDLAKQRQLCLDFLKTGQPPWADKVISPDFLGVMQVKGQGVLGLNKPGPELDGSGRSGDPERVILVTNSTEGPRNVQVRWRKEVMEELRNQKLQRSQEQGKI